MTAHLQEIFSEPIYRDDCIGDIFVSSKSKSESQPLRHALQSELNKRFAVARYRFPTQWQHEIQWNQEQESKHPRGKKGTDKGGKFVSKGDGGGKSTAKPPAAAKQPAYNPLTSTSITTETATTPISAQKAATMRLGSRDYDIIQHGGEWYGKPSGVQWADWQPMSQEAMQAVKQHSHQQNKQGILRAIQAGPVNGNRVWKSLGIPKDDFLDAYFELADAGEVWQDQKNGRIALGREPQPGQRKPRTPRAKATKPVAPPIENTKPKRQTVAEQLTQALSQIKVVKAPELTAEQQEAKDRERKAAEAAAKQRQEESAAEARRAERTENMKTVTDMAEEYGIAPDDLLTAAKDVLKERRHQSDERERAKADARRATGLTLNDIKTAENSGRDFSTIQTRGLTFDKAAQQMARVYPEVFGHADDPNADHSATLWELLREGRSDPPSLYDPEILREAVAMAQPSSIPEEEGELIPFRKPGRPERYALRQAMQREWRRRVAAARAVRYAWNEAEHPRGQPENAGEFVEKGEQSQSVAKTLAQSAHNGKLSRTSAKKQAKAAGVHEQYLAELRLLDSPPKPIITPKQQAANEQRQLECIQRERDRAARLRKENPELAKWLTDSVDYDEERSDDDILDEAANIRDEESEARQQAEDAEQRAEEEYREWKAKKEATENAIEEAWNIFKQNGWKIEQTGSSITGSNYFTLTKPSRFNGDEYGGVDVTLRISNHYAPKGAGFNEQTQEYHSEPDVNIIVTPGQPIDWPTVLQKANEAFDDNDREWS